MARSCRDTHYTMVSLGVTLLLLSLHGVQAQIPDATAAAQQAAQAAAQALAAQANQQAQQAAAGTAAIDAATAAANSAAQQVALRAATQFAQNANTQANVAQTAAEQAANAAAQQQAALEAATFAAAQEAARQAANRAAQQEANVLALRQANERAAASEAAANAAGSRAAALQAIMNAQRAIRDAGEATTSSGNVFRGQFPGFCGHDGMYFRDSTSYYLCEGGVHHVHQCRQGYNARPFNRFSIGQHYSADTYCNVPVHGGLTKHLGGQVPVVPYALPGFHVPPPVVASTHAAVASAFPHSYEFDHQESYRRGLEYAPSHAHGLGHSHDHIYQPGRNFDVHRKLRSLNYSPRPHPRRNQPHGIDNEYNLSHHTRPSYHGLLRPHK